MILLSFIFGAVVGSFLNVCIYRLPKGQSIVFPASHCPHCKQALRFYQNIPIISYLFLGGRCAYCRQPISLRYPVVELLSAVLTVFAYLKFGLTPALFFYLLLFYALIVISFIDFDVHLIPNKILVFALAIAVILNFIFKIMDWQDGISGLLVGGGVLWILATLSKWIFKKEAMGMGDVKFAAVMGFFLGWKVLLGALYVGFVFALIFYVINKLSNSQPIQKYIPMAPFFSLSIVVFIFYGQLIAGYYLSFIGH